MPVPTPAEAEERLRRLLAEKGIPPPDEVRHRAGEVVLLYHEKKLAFVFELSEPWPEDKQCGAPCPEDRQCGAPCPEDRQRGAPCRQGGE